MRILSARVLRARRDRTTSRVEAVVALTALALDALSPETVHVAISAPAAAPDAPPLRQRLIAAAKLTHAAAPRMMRARTWQRHAA
jgi:hypothetical protein